MPFCTLQAINSFHTNAAALDDCLKPQCRKRWKFTGNRSIAAEFQEVQLKNIFENLFTKFKKLFRFRKSLAYVDDIKIVHASAEG